MSSLAKWICIEETILYNVRSEAKIKVGSIIEVLYPTMVFYKKDLRYLEDGDLEKKFMLLAEWRDKQINSILND